MKAENMKLKKSKTRKVVYFEKAIVIPKDHTYVAADYDGAVFSYCENPIPTYLNLVAYT